MSRHPSLPFPMGGEGIRCSPARGMEAVCPLHHHSHHFGVGPGKQAMAHVEDLSGRAAHGVQDLIVAGQCHQRSPGLAATPGGLKPPRGPPDPGVNQRGRDTPIRSWFSLKNATPRCSRKRLNGPRAEEAKASKVTPYAGSTERKRRFVTLNPAWP